MAPNGAPHVAEPHTAGADVFSSHGLSMSEHTVCPRWLSLFIIRRCSPVGTLSSVDQDPGHGGKEGAAESRGQGFAPRCVTAAWPSTITASETPGTATPAGAPRGNGERDWDGRGSGFSVDQGFWWDLVVSRPGLYVGSGCVTRMGAGQGHERVWL